MDSYLKPDFNFYNLALPIIQSSGMGKSRVVDKAAEKRLAFPLNLREDLETPGSHGALQFAGSDHCADNASWQLILLPIG